MSKRLTEMVKSPTYPYQKKINELKRKLRKTDYQALKFAEGELSTAEYAPIREKRKVWRAEINALETEIMMIEG